MNPLRYKMDLAARLSDKAGSLHHALFLRYQVMLLDRILAGQEYLASTFYVPGELAAMYDIPVVYMERISGFAAAVKIINGIRAKRPMFRMPSCGCSYQLMFDCLINEGILPPPSGFIAAGFSCDDAWMYCKTAAIKYNIPLCLVDVIQGKDRKYDLKYLGNQLKEANNWFSRRYKRVSGFEKVINASNRAMKIKLDIDRFRIRYPGIISSIECLKLFTLYNDLGRDYACDVFKELHSFISQKVADYYIPKCARILWLGIVPLYKNSLPADIERKYFCRIVFEELFDFNDTFVVPQSFYGDLARRITNSLFFSTNSRLFAITKYCRDLKIDGIIHFSQHNCRFLPPMLPILFKKVETIGVPLLDISGDAIDEAGFDEQRLGVRLETFFEQVNRRRRKCMLRSKQEKNSELSG